jgi:two-component system, chemotaxis family, protein-glutamate methylesterase/glutaminase
MIRALVVDDSAFMRKAISMMLESDPGITVVDTARDGLEAIEKVAALKPDIVTMDVEMPRMDGLTAVRRIMQTMPVPILMISSLTREGAEVTIQALAAGALDFIPKKNSTVSLAINQIREDLLTKVHAITSRRPAPSRPRAEARREAGAVQPGRFDALVIGTSTGGPFALQQVLPALPAEFPLPVLVVQHMPPHFTRSLAERLDSLSPLNVKEASDGDVVRPGHVFIAQGGVHMHLDRKGSDVRIRTSDEPETLHRPSVDVMFSSAAKAFERPLLAVVMTGMGRDGLDGCRAIKEKGGYLVAQDEASCVVYGMPRAVAEAGLVDLVRPLTDIAGTIAPAGLRTANQSTAAPATISAPRS